METGVVMRLQGRSRRLVPSLGLVGLLIYIGWLGTPYLRSIVVRDAAVTSWISLAAAPISGYIDQHPLYPGQVVGAAGGIAGIGEPRADAVPLARARAEFDRAQAKVAALTPLVETTRRTAETRETLLADYLVAIREDIDARIAAASGNLAAAK